MEIMRRTGAEVVFTTTWRVFHYMDFLKRAVAPSNPELWPRFVGMTPDTDHHDRQGEIREWLSSQPGGGAGRPMLAIDDESCLYSEPTGFLYETEGYDGLVEDDVEMIVERLCGQGGGG